MPHPFAIVPASFVGNRPRWWCWGEENARLHATEIEPGDLHTDPPEPADDGELPSHALVLAGADRWLTVVDEDDDVTDTMTAADFADANLYIAADVLALDLGASMVIGGGAEPLVTVTRLS